MRGSRQSVSAMKIWLEHEIDTLMTSMCLAECVSSFGNSSFDSFYEASWNMTKWADLYGIIRGRTALLFR